MILELKYGKVMMVLSALLFALNVLDIMETETGLRAYPDRLYESNPYYYIWGKTMYIFKLAWSLAIAGIAYLTVRLVQYFESFNNTWFSFMSVVLKVVSLAILSKNVVFTGIVVLNNMLLQMPK